MIRWETILHGVSNLYCMSHATVLTAGLLWFSFTDGKGHDNGLHGHRKVKKNMSKHLPSMVRFDPGTSRTQVRWVSCCLTGSWIGRSLGLPCPIRYSARVPQDWGQPTPWTPVTWLAYGDQVHDPRGIPKASLLLRHLNFGSQVHNLFAISDTILRFYI